MRAERAAMLRAAIDRLSPKLAAVILLRYPQGLAYEEIGEILDLPPGTVRSRLNRAHAALREMLGERLDEI
jgi:RNA polymerase sigma-70 factor (ECF subfamily)